MTRERRNRLLNLIIGVTMVVGVLSWMATIYMDSIRGNKLPSSMDTYQTFNVAYVLGNNNKWERIQISCWMPDGDNRIQIVDTNDVPIYMHFSNVKLTYEK